MGCRFVSSYFLDTCRFRYSDACESFSSWGDLDQDAPHWLRIFWSSAITVVTIGLLFAGNFAAMQTVVVLAGLPFSVILILYMIGLYKTMKAEEREPTRSPAWIESHLSYDEAQVNPQQNAI